MAGNKGNKMAKNKWLPAVIIGGFGLGWLLTRRKIVPIPPPPPPPGMGTLNITSSPSGATVRDVDSSLVGVTPLSVDLDPGVYPFTLSLTGYQDASRTATIVAGKVTGISVTLVPVPSGRTITVRLIAGPYASADSWAINCSSLAGAGIPAEHVPLDFPTIWEDIQLDQAWVMYGLYDPSGNILSTPNAATFIFLTHSLEYGKTYFMDAQYGVFQDENGNII